jgi:ADP-ribosyl-[dinitrogen reductase] hydrolase
MKSLIYSALFGVAVGDALGVPVEFKSRPYLQANPVTNMTGFGTHHQPAGTWSDDSSLTFCLAEMLCEAYNLRLLSKLFVDWYNAKIWTPHGKVFDIGIATSQALHSLSKGISPTSAGGTSEDSNGNGSLMRILPIIFFIKDLPIERRFQIVNDVSSVTHAHIRSVLGCFIYTEMALQLIKEKDKLKAFNETIHIVNDFLNRNAICSQTEIDKYHRILQNPIGNYNIIPIYDYYEAEINSSGYVLHTLEASIWCLFHTDSYQEAVLKAVNLGGDTDTTGAVTGGLAGLLYGYESIPKEWIDCLARKNDIEDLCDRLALKMNK